jgi:hypothetical protein
LLNNLIEFLRYIGGAPTGRGQTGELTDRASPGTHKDAGKACRRTSIGVGTTAIIGIVGSTASISCKYGV